MPVKRELADYWLKFHKKNNEDLLVTLKVTAQKKMAGVVLELVQYLYSYSIQVYITVSGPVRIVSG